MEYNIWDVFASVADACSRREAIVSGDSRLSYGDLMDRSARLGQVLRSQGLGCRRERAELDNWESGQDMVGLYLLNGREYMEATLGGYGSRVAPFNVNYRYVAEELAYLLDDADTAALVYHARFTPTLAEVLPRIRRRPVLLQVADASGHPLLDGAIDYEEALAAASPSLADVSRSPDDLYVLYTGGTTGMPKGTLWRQSDAYLACLGGDSYGPDATVGTVAQAAAASAVSRFIPNAPFMHGAAHWLGLRQLLSGGTIVLNGVVDHFDPVDMWSTIEREQVASALFVGESQARPAMDAFESGSFDATPLKVVIVGGAVTSPETKDRILRSLPHALILDAAGSSETGTALSRTTVAGAGGELGVFQARPGTAVLDSELNRSLAPGEDEVGWFAKTGRIPLGYLGDPAKTEATFPVVDGVRWSVPGDRARLRADGSVELLGRDSVTINSGGEKIFAEEVEQALLLHPAMEDAVVTGRPSERWGQEVVAVVALKPGSVASDDELLQVAAGRIARFKLPKAIIRVGTVVRSPAGKADYRWAKAVATDPQYSGGGDRAGDPASRA